MNVSFTYLSHINGFSDVDPEIPEESRKTRRLKRCKYNKDEDNSPKTPNVK